jgi:hypothetical protein
MPLQAFRYPIPFNICMLFSTGPRVGIYTTIATLVMLIVGLYVFLEYNFIVGFVMIALAAVYYFGKKRQMGIR